jgi:hypothetical protein
MLDREPIPAGLSGQSALLQRIEPSAVALTFGVLLAVAVLIVRIPAALDGMDSVNFALGLHDFDPGLEQPHWPGYPLFILLARVLWSLGFPESAALALPGVLALPVLAWATVHLSRRLELDRRAGLLAAALLLIHPLLIDQGPRPIPDLLGTAFAWSALALLASGRACASGLLFGLALGVRVDLAPLAGALLVVPGQARRSFASTWALGVALWALPLAAHAPPEWLPSLTSFAGGHFSAWGSSLTAGAGTRSAVLAALDLLGPGVLGLFAVAYGARALPERPRRFLLASAGAYSAWVLIGQNLAHARHWLPLLPALCLCLAQALVSAEKRSARACLAISVLALATPAYLRAFASQLDGRVLVEQALAACEDCDAIFVGDEKRFFDRYAPHAAVYRRDRVAEIALDVAAWGDAVEGEIGILSTVQGADIQGVEIPHAPGIELAPGIVLYRVAVSELR